MKTAWWAAAGAVLGLVLAPTLGLSDDAVFKAYDWLNPVVHGTATVTRKSEESWLISMESEKARDCILLDVQAYDTAPNNSVERLAFGRHDNAPRVKMPPGTFRSADYLLVPPPKFKLKIDFLHDCDGRTIRTPIKVIGG